jgi:hypothetical protein
VMGAAYWSVFRMITLPDTEDWPYTLVRALARMLVRMVAGQRATAGGRTMSETRSLAGGGRTMSETRSLAGGSPQAWAWAVETAGRGEAGA